MLTILRRYRDFFVPLIGVLLVPFLTGATVFINPFMSFPAAGGSYLLEDNLEYANSAAAISGGWTDSGVTWAYATSPAPLQGTYSVSGTTSGTTSRHSFTAGATRYIYLIGYTSALTNNPYIIKLYDSTFTDVMAYIRFLSAGGVRIANGTTLTASADSTVTGATTYHMWLEYTTGSGANGVTRVYVSTTSTKPGTATAEITNGNGTEDLGHIELTPGSATTVIWDRVIVSSTVIGSSP